MLCDYDLRLNILILSFIGVHGIIIYAFAKIQKYFHLQMKIFPKVFEMEGGALPFEAHLDAPLLAVVGVD